ncbi:MAG: acyl carrier protein [Ramlibacter sp.]|nr:acyl carrier protein [Ramlibacter sp.]
MSVRTVSRTKDEIAHWCIEFVTKNLDIPASKIDLSSEFESFGLDSAATVGLVVELEEWLGRTIDPTVVFEHPTIGALAGYLAGETA